MDGLHEYKRREPKLTSSTGLQSVRTTVEELSSNPVAPVAAGPQATDYRYLILDSGAELHTVPTRSDLRRLRTSNLARVRGFGGTIVESRGNTQAWETETIMTRLSCLRLLKKTCGKLYLECTSLCPTLNSTRNWDWMVSPRKGDNSDLGQLCRGRQLFYI